MDDRAVFERHECLLHAIACLTAAKAVPRAIVHYTHAGEMEQHGGGAIVSSSEKPCRSLRLVAESYALTLLLKHLTSRSEDDEARHQAVIFCLSNRCAALQWQAGTTAVCLLTERRSSRSLML